MSYETANIIYYCCHAIAAIVSLVLTILLSKHYPMPRWKVVISLALDYAFLYALLFVLGAMTTGFKQWGSKNVVRGILFLPLISFTTSKLLKISNKHMNNIISIIIGIATGITHIGCIFAGCCIGYPSKFGIYDFMSKTTVFPTTIILILMELCLGLFMYIYQKKNNYLENNLGFPIVMIFFGFFRFVIEFLMNNKVLFIGLHEFHFWCIAIFIFGTIWYYVSKRSAIKQVDEKGVVKNEQNSNE